MTILLRLLLIAALVWALLRLLRNLLFGSPSSSQGGSQGSAGSGKDGADSPRADGFEG